MLTGGGPNTHSFHVRCSALCLSIGPLFSLGLREEHFHYLLRLGCQSLCSWPKFEMLWVLLGEWLQGYLPNITQKPFSRLHPYAFRHGLDLISRTVPWDLLTSPFPSFLLSSLHSECICLCFTDSSDLLDVLPPQRLFTSSFPPAAFPITHSPSCKIWREVKDRCWSAQVLLLLCCPSHLAPGHRGHGASAGAPNPTPTHWPPHWPTFTQPVWTQIYSSLLSEYQRDNWPNI